MKWSGRESDQALADSVKKSGNVIMLADAVDEASHRRSPCRSPQRGRTPGIALAIVAEPRPLVLPPYQALADASAALGHNFLALDNDGPARRMAPFIVRGSRSCRRSASPRR